MELEVKISSTKLGLSKGLNDLYSLISEELSDYRRRESLNPKVEMPKVDSLKRLVSFIDFYKTT